MGPGPQGRSLGEGALVWGFLFVFNIQEQAGAWVQAPACLTCRNQTHKMVKAYVVGGLFIHNKLETCYNLHMAKLLWRSGFNLLGPWKVALRPYCPPPSSTPTPGTSGQKERLPVGRAEVH